MRRCVLLALTSLAILGCGDGLKKFPSAKVTGKVLCDGQPIANLRVNFAPVRGQGAESGKMGMGETDSDGEFIVSTYGQGDGAVVGKHDVSVSPPSPEDFPDFKCDCETVGNKKPVQQVEVSASGENKFTINLPAKKNKKQSNFSAEDTEELKEAGKLP